MASMIDERTIFTEDWDVLAQLQSKLETLVATVRVREQELAKMHAVRTALAERQLPTDDADLAALEGRLRDALADVAQRRAQLDG